MPSATTKKGSVMSTEPSSLPKVVVAYLAAAIVATTFHICNYPSPDSQQHQQTSQKAAPVVLYSEGTGDGPFNPDVRLDTSRIRTP